MKKRQITREEELRREQEQRRIFFEGLKRYQDRGIPIFINGREGSIEELEKLLEVKEDGAFYMGDYIGSDSGKLTEIHFDKVYYK